MNQPPITNATQPRTGMPGRHSLTVILLLGLAFVAAVAAGFWVTAGMARAMAGPTAAAFGPATGQTGELFRDAAGDPRDGRPGRISPRGRNAAESPPRTPHTALDATAGPN